MSRDGRGPCARRCRSCRRPRCRPSRSSRWPARCSRGAARPERLVRVFRALAGWLPGGTAVAAVLVCAFFTTFTGASGVTILALGSLLLPVLMKDVYSRAVLAGHRHRVGQHRPALPAEPPDHPLRRVQRGPRSTRCSTRASCRASCWSAWCRRTASARAWPKGATWKRVDPREIAASLWAAKWEIALPVVVFVSLFGGFATTVEAAALTVLYTLFIKCVVYRDVSVRRELPKVLTESADARGRRAHHPLRGHGVHQLPDRRARSRRRARPG